MNNLFKNLNFKVEALYKLNSDFNVIPKYLFILNISFRVLLNSYFRINLYSTDELLKNRGLQPPVIGNKLMRHRLRAGGFRGEPPDEYPDHLI